MFRVGLLVRITFEQRLQGCEGYSSWTVLRKYIQNRRNASEKVTYLSIFLMVQQILNCKSPSEIPPTF